jgi:hypothetical protein
MFALESNVGTSSKRQPRMEGSSTASEATNQLQSSSRERQPASSATFAQPTSVVTFSTVDKSTYPASSRAPAASSAAASFKYTNHERTAATTTTSGSDQPDNAKPPAPAPVAVSAGGVGAVESPTVGLRRVKTEASTLSTKEYFERKQREQHEREKAAANMLQLKQLKTEAAATTGNVLSPPAKMAKLEAGSLKPADRAVEQPEKYMGDFSKSGVQQDRYIHGESTLPIKTVGDVSHLKVEPNAKSNATMSPLINRQPKTEVPTYVKNLGGICDPSDQKSTNPSDQRSSNIFERMQGSEAKPNERSKGLVSAGTASFTLQANAEGLQQNKSAEVRSNTRPEFIPSSHQSIPGLHGSFSQATSSDSATPEMTSSSMERSRHDRRPHGLVEKPSDPASVTKPSDRRRSSRRDSGAGTPLASPNKPSAVENSSDFSSPIPVIGANPAGGDTRGGHKRKRSTDSEHQHSPLKLKLSLPGPASGSSHTESPLKHFVGGGGVASSHASHHSRAAAATTAAPSPSAEPLSSSALSESQERIRLKLSLSEGRVEKVPTSSSTSAGSGVKIVLSKDKLSGAYQSGANQTAEQQQHHHHHHKRHHQHHSSERDQRLHHHRSHKQPPQQLPDSDNGRHSSNSADAQLQQQQRSHHRSESSNAVRVPPEKHQYLNAASYGNGHYANQQPAFGVNRQQSLPSAAFAQQTNYRTAVAVASIPPPPPPPLPNDEPVSTPPPPPLPPQ